MIPSAVFVPAVAKQTTFHSPANFEKSWEYPIDVFTCFVDLEKTYDRVPREKLWGVLREHGVDDCLLLAAMSLYSYSDVCVRVGRVKSRPFTFGVGLRQGCVLSPLLFIVYISGSQPVRWREPNPDLRFCWRASLKFLTQFNWHVLFYNRTNSVIQNVRRFIERPVRAAQRVPGSRMRPSEPRLRNTGLHELDRQSQPNRRGCHSRELQDQQFTFCRRFGTASIFSTACTRSVFCCVRPNRKSALKIPRICLSTNPRQCMRQVSGNTLQ